jgi:hypothetical protein
MKEQEANGCMVSAIRLKDSNGSALHEAMLDYSARATKFHQTMHHELMNDFTERHRAADAVSCIRSFALIRQQHVRTVSTYNNCNLFTALAVTENQKNESESIVQATLLVPRGTEYYWLSDVLTSAATQTR